MTTECSTLSESFTSACTSPPSSPSQASGEGKVPELEDGEEGWEMLLLDMALRISQQLR